MWDPPLEIIHVKFNGRGLNLQEGKMSLKLLHKTVVIHFLKAKKRIIGSTPSTIKFFFYEIREKEEVVCMV